MTPTAEDLQTTVSTVPSRMAAIVRRLEYHPKAYHLTVGPEGGRWPSTATLGQSRRFPGIEMDELTTEPDLATISDPAILEKLGYALRSLPRSGDVAAIEKPSMVSQHRPAQPAPWVEEVMSKMAEVARLPANWDSYGARPIRKECLQFAWTEILQGSMHDATPAPSVVPTNTGGVMLEWHCGNMDLEVRVEQPGEIVVYYADSATGEEGEFAAERPGHFLANLLWKLSQRG